jgi:secondary thiamine-phosphate synthase enzyme
LSELSAIHNARVETIARAVLAVQTSGEGFFEITREVARFLEKIKARDGMVLLYLRHTSASLVIQENADPDVQTDLVTALERIAPADAGWVHDVEGPDDMPAHIKAMVNGVSLPCRSQPAKWSSAPGRTSMWPSTARGRTAARWCCNFSAVAANSQL